MLFSQPQIVRIVNLGFEPVWQSVRPVPIVTIDFGEGRKITRTLHGNIATYICTPSGQVVDVLPGLYTAEVYAARLMALMAEAALAPKSEPEFGKWLISRHEDRLKRAKEDEKAKREGRRIRDITKTITLERSVFLALRTPPEVKKVPQQVIDALGSPDQATVWKALVEDTRLNDTVRREQVSRYLADTGSTSPKAMTKWLYREVLDADIDDPWLGLKDLSDASVFDSVESQPGKLAAQK